MIIMKDDIELQELFKKMGIVIGIFLILTALLVIMISRKYNNSSKIIKEVNKEATFYVLVYDNSCKTCKRIIEMLKEEKINYYEMNTDKDGKYKSFLRSIDSSENDIAKPTLMYIKEGKLDSTIVSIKDEDILKAFLEKNNK